MRGSELRFEEINLVLYEDFDVSDMSSSLPIEALMPGNLFALFKVYQLLCNQIFKNTFFFKYGVIIIFLRKTRYITIRSRKCRTCDDINTIITQMNSDILISTEDIPFC
jgi:hypothetical protein